MKKTSQQKTITQHTFDQAYAQLEDELRTIADNRSTARQKRDRSLKLIQAALYKLDRQLRAGDFQDSASEIHFFKHIKPRFTSLYHLENQLWQLQYQNEAVTKTALRIFYETELHWIEHTLHKEAFHYQYYRLQASELDHHFFLRQPTTDISLIPAIPNLDRHCTTAVSELFAQFRALEMLREHILHQLSDQSNINNGFIRPGRKAAPLHWTGSTIHAVELGYALWRSDQLNGGEAELADIMHWLSTTLQLDLSRYTRLFIEIKARKILSRTKFIDLLQDAVRQYIDQRDCLKRK